MADPTSVADVAAYLQQFYAHIAPDKDGVQFVAGLFRENSNPPYANGLRAFAKTGVVNEEAAQAMRDFQTRVGINGEDIASFQNPKSESFQALQALGKPFVQWQQMQRDYPELAMKFEQYCKVKGQEAFQKEHGFTDETLPDYIASLDPDIRVARATLLQATSAYGFSFARRELPRVLDDVAALGQDRVVTRLGESIANHASYPTRDELERDRKNYDTNPNNPATHGKQSPKLPPHDIANGGYDPAERYPSDIRALAALGLNVPSLALQARIARPLENGNLETHGVNFDAYHVPNDTKPTSPTLTTDSPADIRARLQQGGTAQSRVDPLLQAARTQRRQWMPDAPADLTTSQEISAAVLAMDAIGHIREHGGLNGSTTLQLDGRVEGRDVDYAMRNPELFHLLVEQFYRDNFTQQTDMQKQANNERFEGALRALPQFQKSISKQRE